MTANIRSKKRIKMENEENHFKANLSSFVRFSIWSKNLPKMI